LTNLKPRARLVAEAPELGADVVPAGEVPIAAAVADRGQERWLAENQGALESSNDFVERYGLPLSKFRTF
jgi:antitoxin CcdA